MSKSVSGGSTSSSGGSYTNEYETLYADSFTNYVGMTSQQATITTLAATTLTASGSFYTPSGSFNNLYSSSGTIVTLTNTTSMTSPSANITNLSSTNATVSNLNSSAVVNSGTINTHHLTASGDIYCENATIVGNLTYGALDLTNIAVETLTVGTASVSFPANTSEFDATTIVFDIDNKFSNTDFIDKRTGLGVAQIGSVFEERRTGLSYNQGSFNKT